MKNKILLVAIGMMVALIASARMTDAEVIEYIQKQTAAGKSENVIGRELVARGVSPEQVERIKSQIDNRNRNRNDNNINIDSSLSTPEKQDDKISYTRGSRTSTATTRRTGQSPDRDRNMTGTGEDEAVFETMPAEGRRETARREIYGHNVFNENNLTFAPGENLATPQDYVLGPGDEVIIDIWGENEEHIRQTISPEGSIMVAQIGPVYFNGQTIKEANNTIRDKFARKYGGVADLRSDINLSLGQVRSIQVDVMGEVSEPGSFRMSPFSTVFHALYNAGGINDIGSLRNIEVLRKGKRVATVDIYDYLFKGKQTGNIRLQEGDVIIVPPYSDLVSIEGNVKRPMYYEITPGETVGTLLNYSGGFTGDAYSDMVRLSRATGRENELVNVARSEYKNYRLKDGDRLTVGTIRDRYTNRVELRGAVMRPGEYALGNEIFTVRDLINKADGLTEDAYTGRVMLYRETPDLSLEVEAIDLGAILDGSAPDIELRRNDMIEVASIHELNDSGTLTIMGEVNLPGEYPYAINSTVEDLIIRAGGLRQGASTARVDVSRRIVDPTAVQPSDQISQTFSLSIDKGLLVEGDSGFHLEPYDVVTIRRSPGYSPQEFVDVNGEVAFTGPYVLTHKNERISEVISRAGGLTKGAYIKGASLVRRLSPEEIETRQKAIDEAQLAMAVDSIPFKKITVSEYFNVGIDLEKALAGPGGQYDIVLKPGDRITVPEYVSTVSVSGEVMHPNTVTFQKGMKVKDYVEFAGGYTDKANKGRAYIVYMNGNIKRAGKGSRLEPGCQIIVPAKAGRKSSSFAEIMGYISSFASLGVMAASIASLLK